MITFKEFLNESEPSMVETLLDRALRREGLGYKVEKKIGFTKYTIKGTDYSIVYDKSNILVYKSKKEIELFDRPKMDYKKAVALVADKIEKES